LYENGLGFEESFIPVERCEEEGRVARRVGQETEVLLLYVDKVRKALRDREYLLFSCVQHGDWWAIWP
jgi:hypothetical protein